MIRIATFRDKQLATVEQEFQQMLMNSSPLKIGNKLQSISNKKSWMKSFSQEMININSSVNNNSKEISFGYNSNNIKNTNSTLKITNNNNNNFNKILPQSLTSLLNIKRNRPVILDRNHNLNHKQAQNILLLNSNKESQLKKNVISSINEQQLNNSNSNDHIVPLKSNQGGVQFIKYKLDEKKRNNHNKMLLVPSAKLSFNQNSSTFHIQTSSTNNQDTSSNNNIIANSQFNFDTNHSNNNNTNMNTNIINKNNSISEINNQVQYNNNLQGSKKATSQDDDKINNSLVIQECQKMNISQESIQWHKEKKDDNIMNTIESSYKKSMMNSTTRSSPGLLTSNSDRIPKLREKQLRSQQIREKVVIGEKRSSQIINQLLMSEKSNDSLLAKNYERSQQMKQCESLKLKYASDISSNYYDQDKSNLSHHRCYQSNWRRQSSITEQPEESISYDIEPNIFQFKIPSTSKIDKRSYQKVPKLQLMLENSDNQSQKRNSTLTITSSTYDIGPQNSSMQNIPHSFKILENESLSNGSLANRQSMISNIDNTRDRQDLVGSVSISQIKSFLVHPELKPSFTPQKIKMTRTDSSFRGVSGTSPFRQKVNGSLITTFNKYKRQSRPKSAQGYEINIYGLFQKSNSVKGNLNGSQNINPNNNNNNHKNKVVIKNLNSHRKTNNNSMVSLRSWDNNSEKEDSLLVKD